MSGVCIDKLPHSCGTRRGLQVFADPETGKVDGYCFSCHTRVANPYGVEKTVDQIDMPAPKTEKEIQSEIAEVSSYPVVDLPTRKLRAKYLKFFGIKVALSEEDGKTPSAMYSPMYKEGKLRGYYVKTLLGEKVIWSIGDVKDCEPFGWEQAKKSGAYKLIIVEGIEDAVAVKSIFDRYGDPEYAPAVISLSNGTKSVKKNLGLIADEANRKFKEIIICFDDDKPGHKAMKEAIAILPKALTTTLPEKDANDCILKGAQKAAHNALAYQTARPKNSRLLVANKDLHLLYREPTPWGDLTWPFPKFNDLLRGIRYGETIYIGAGVKMGKSELLNAVVAHFIREHNIKVMVAKPEEDVGKTYKLICNKMVGHIFHDPNVEFDYDDYDKAGEMLENKLYMIDIFQHLGWESLKVDITQAAADGCKAVFIDPITNLTNGMDAASANTKIQEIAQDLSAMAKDLDIVVFIFCHLKAHEGNISREVRVKKYDKGQYVHLGNCPHEFGGDVISSQFAGSRAMMRSCNLMLGLEGNKDEELEPDIRSLRWLRILEDREFGNSDSVCLHYNKSTTYYTEAA